MNEGACADRNIPKGEIIHTFSPPLFISWSQQSQLFAIQFCQVCGASMQCYPQNETFPGCHFESLPIALPCSKCNMKEPLFCSTYCRTLAEEHGFPILHNICSCSGSTFLDQEHRYSMKKFMEKIMPRRDCDDKDERFAIIFTAFVYYTIVYQGAESPFYSLYSREKDSRLYDIEESQQVSEWSFECWTILYSYYHKTDLNHTSSWILDPENFVRLRRRIQSSCLLYLSSPHPIAQYIKSHLISLQESDLTHALNKLEEFISAVYDHPKAKVEDMNPSLLSWRKATRLIQALDGGILSLFPDGHPSQVDWKKDLFLKLQRHHAVLDIQNFEKNHSCIPMAIVEASTNNHFSASMGPLKYQLSALHNISIGDNITISRLDDLTLDVKKRQYRLKRMFGNSFECYCPRCTCERNWHVRDDFAARSGDEEDRHDRITLKPSDLRRLGDLAMQQGRYHDADELYSIFLTHEPCDGDVLHARCASHLARGHFIRAHTMWKEAVKIAPSHEGIQLHVLKYSAYNQGGSLLNFSKISSLIQYRTIIPFKCYMTEDNSPLLTRQECSRIIQIAEDEASRRRNGWTTSRHYAVPTTDLPIHEISALLPRFNQIMDRVYALLCRQFGANLNIYIHDAFVVKYDASMGQRHLPLHRDESTHSFVIALNDTSEFTGGGTYIEKLNESLRPTVGGIISFRGDELLHGGDPVVTGTRYIIVAFCYQDHHHSSPVTILTTKKRRILEDSAPASTFTFNFKLL